MLNGSLDKKCFVFINQTGLLGQIFLFNNQYIKALIPNAYIYRILLTTPVAVTQANVLKLVLAALSFDPLSSYLRIFSLNLKLPLPYLRLIVVNNALDLIVKLYFCIPAVNMN